MELQQLIDLQLPDESRLQQLDDLQHNGKVEVTSDYLVRLKQFLEDVQKGQMSAADVTLFSTSDVLTLALVDPKVNLENHRQLISNVVKLPDLLANAFKGKIDLQVWFSRLLRTLNHLRYLKKSETVSTFIELFVLNYSGMSEVMSQMVKTYVTFTEHFQDSLESLVLNISISKQESLIKNLSFQCQSPKDFQRLFGVKLPSICFNVFERILFTAQNMSENVLKSFISYFCQCLSEKEYVCLLKKSLSLWGDPVIAKSYVSREVIHFTRVSLAIFIHGQEKVVLDNERNIIELLVKGLPNHFNSTDGRTIVLAKFFSEILTESLKAYTQKDQEILLAVVKTNDSICQDLLRVIHDCQCAHSYWINIDQEIVNKVQNLNINERENGNEMNEENKEALDEDDDSDLEPIETLEAPKKCPIKYLRNFLESFPELEDHSSVSDSLKALPNIIHHQLNLEHPQVGKDLMQQIFLWENQYDDPSLDEGRKMALETVLTTKVEGNLEFMCQLFYRDHVQPYRKNIIFEVMSRASKKLNLKDLQYLCRGCFRHLLIDENVIKNQDVTVRIPFIMFFSRLLSQLPVQMVEEQMVVDFMRAIVCIGDVDSATEQAIGYAVSHVMNCLGENRLLQSSNVKDCIRDTRDWFLAIQARR